MPIISKINMLSKSPQIATLPEKLTGRLIDNGMLYYEASLSGFAERYSKGETSHTIHVWWARRPHSTMRAIVFASLCKDRSEKAISILKNLSSSFVPQEKILSEAKEVIKYLYPSTPKLLDMFSGGGTIPMESCNLGVETYSVDANELSVFIQRCNLIYSQNVSQKRIEIIIKDSGMRIINQLAEETEILFPLRKRNPTFYDPENIFGYIWTYSMQCNICGFTFYLSKRPWLSKKKGKYFAFFIKNGKAKQRIELAAAPSDYKMSSVWIGRNGRVQCPKCKITHSSIDINLCRDELIALVKPSKGHGKEFLSPIENSIPNIDFIKKIEKTVSAELGIELPKSILPCWSGIVNPAIYGIKTHSDFLNPRQRVVLLLLVKALRNEYNKLIKEENEDTARYVIGVLSSFIDQLVDWNCRLSMWISQNEQVGRAFCGPGISMFWDYIEIDPVLRGPANLWSKLDRILSGVKSISKFTNKIYVNKGYAQSLDFPDEFFDAIVTDPPYYDNIYYSVLSDFFFAWKKLVLNSIEPELFSSESTDWSKELVASKFRSGDKQKAHEDYCNQLELALKEAERVIKLDGVFSFIFSHSSQKAWEAIVKAYRATKFRVTSIQPLSIERKQRPRAMTSQAVNTCITFVAHKSNSRKTNILKEELQENLREIGDYFALKLKEVGWSDKDTALAIFANGIGLLANSSGVTGCKDDLEALQLLKEVVNEKFPLFNIEKRGSL